MKVSTRTKSGSTSRPMSPDVLTANCPSRKLLDHITSKWGVLVLVALSQDTMRWGELRRRVEGVSEKMLAQTLRTLEHDGFVHRAAAPTIPPRVDYSLTASGRDLTAQLLPLIDWIGEHADVVLRDDTGDHPAG